MKFGIVRFPGSDIDDLTYVITTVINKAYREIWYQNDDLSDLQPGDCLILPHGTAFGAFLRPGAIASVSPIMKAVIDFAERGGKVWGIGNGFQILCEAGLLSGTLLQNSSGKFVCKNIFLKTITNHSALTASILDKATPLKIPIAHKFGRFYASAMTLEALEKNDQILFRYSNEVGEFTPACNPDGSLANIAAICNANRNVFGMMPLPQRATEEELGNSDGKILFDSLIHQATNMLD